MRYVSAKEARDYFQIGGNTLKVWKDKGKLKYKRFTNRKILYDIDSFTDTVTNYDIRKNVIYARVSNTKQKYDLEHQIETIKNYMLSNGVEANAIYSEIASGMNENRKELNKLINDVIANKIDTIYITYKDRLTRFGFDYFKNLFEKFDTKIKVLNETDSNNIDYNNELSNDIISIIHHFSMKLYSNRRKQLKEIEHIIKSEK